jgi:hypothetical protein
MKLSPNIDLGKSLRQVFGDDPESAAQVEHDRARQEATANAILKRFVARNPANRRELIILADEVGLGKTYVALAVAVSMLDAIRNGESPEGVPANKPVVLVLTPTNDALFNKWMREAEAFKTDCALDKNNPKRNLDWLDIRCPIQNSSQSGNILHLAREMQQATRSRPMILIAKYGALGAALNNRDWWRTRALAIVFESCKICPDDRKWWCRQILGTVAKTKVAKLLDLRKSYSLWTEASKENEVSTNLYQAFHRVIQDKRIRPRLDRLISARNSKGLLDALDDLTRLAIAGDLPCLSLVIVDEMHNLKNEEVQVRRHLESLLKYRVCRVLGLSATPFQLRQDELLSILKLRKILMLPGDRHEALDVAVEKLSEAMKSSRESGDIFRRRWRALRPRDQVAIEESWRAVVSVDPSEQRAEARKIRPPRIAHALEAALDLEQLNRALQKHLQPIVIRHQHPRGYREYFVGQHADIGHTQGTPHFSWAPGLEVRGQDELAHYLMMRAVALAKDEKGLPGLGAELTGSYRHLVETSAVWKRLATAKNTLLQDYRAVLDHMIGHRSEGHDPDREHRKVQATVRRALEFFKRGQKTLIFCVFTKTAETVRDRLQAEIDQFFNETKLRVFGDGSSFENFRKRFFNRREPLFSLIQDHPLLGNVEDGALGIPSNLKLTEAHLREVAILLVAWGEPADDEKPDRRLLLAATEHVAVNAWQTSADGQIWLGGVLSSWKDAHGRLQNPMAAPDWLEGREPLSRSERAGRVRRSIDPEARTGTEDPLDLEQLDEEAFSADSNKSQEKEIAAWMRRLQRDAIGEVIEPYFDDGLISRKPSLPPLLAQHHGELLAKFDLATRAVAGQVFRRTLMAEEFLLRYLADVERDNAAKWVDYLAERYVKHLGGHFESLKERVQAFLETLARAKNNRALLSGYYAAAENRNVVQLVKGGMDRDRYFLGFNTPYRPEILVSTAVGQEGIDLHRECRHVIHHDLCWNPATIEQRTGRVDRIGSKVERERMGANGKELPTLEIAVPYLAATYDERMFEELHRRAQLFEVTLGGDMRVEGRIQADQVKGEKQKREKAGIGTEDEDLGEEGNDTGAVDLPQNMIERLRVDLAVWNPRRANENTGA